MHALVERQLRRYGGSLETPPEHWARFLQAVSEAYEASDHDRVRIERSMDLMSKELNQRYDDLRKDNRNLGLVEEALRASERRLRAEIEDRKRMEVELRLKQKLEAVGQLAAGIAHEINTPVQFIGDSTHFLQSAFEDYRKLLERYRTTVPAKCAPGNLSALAEELKAAETEADLDYLDAQVPSAFARVRDGTARVSSIVGAVKEFAHPDQREMAPADLNRAIESTLVVAKNEYKFVADVQTRLGDLPQVECHIGDLNQVFLNLIVNGAHAIADRIKDVPDGRGLITIATAIDGSDARITVSDTGSGIPEHVRGRVFDPFFTTKEVGRGTGQGLAICRSIVVEKHGGSLTFETVVGEGTTFEVRVPLRGAAAVREAA